MCAETDTSGHENNCTTIFVTHEMGRESERGQAVKMSPRLCKRAFLGVAS